MDDIARLPQKSREELFSETAAQIGITPIIAEKDFWTCWVLGKLFSTVGIREKIVFKGGTTLSKVFRLIERFSEDIDLILNWNLITDTPPREGAEKLSKNQQNKFNEEILNRSRSYLQSEFLPLVRNSLLGVADAEISPNETDVISVEYPNAFSDEYVRAEIRLEIGALASWLPNKMYSIKSYAAECFPDKFDNPDANVKAIKAERTFWEKITILHAEAHRSEQKVQPARYSRHYYDVFCMAKSENIDEYLRSFEMLDSVIEFKKTYYPSGWAHYDNAKIGSLKLVPPEYIRVQLEKDFVKMRSMIFGDIPAFAEMMDKIRELEQKINDKSGLIARSRLVFIGFDCY